jgi:hypothetical protein
MYCTILSPNSMMCLSFILGATASKKPYSSPSMEPVRDSWKVRSSPTWCRAALKNLHQLVPLVSARRCCLCPTYSTSIWRSYVSRFGHSSIGSSLMDFLICSRSTKLTMGSVSNDNPRFATSIISEAERS